MMVHIIRADGTEEKRDARCFRDIAPLIGAETVDTVNLRDGRVMLVDDAGWDYEVLEVGPGHLAHVPTRPRRPINAKATELYHGVCRPGTTHEIAGDVALVRASE